MQRVLVTILAVLVALAGSEIVLAQPDAFQVVVNASNPVTRLPKARLAKLFLKKETRWESGLAAMPIDQKADNATRASFTRAVIGRDVQQVLRFWRRVIFSGLDVPPPELASDDEVLALVGTNAGAVGYVAAGTALDDRVKTLEIVE